MFHIRIGGFLFYCSTHQKLSKDAWQHQNHRHSTTSHRSTVLARFWRLFRFYPAFLFAYVTLFYMDAVFDAVAVGKREYSGNIGQDVFSFPVTSLRDSMVMTLYDEDRDLVSRTEVNTKAIVELGTMDAVFTLESGGKIILQLQFLLSDEDRKRIQEMRNSAVKRKQQELLENGYVLRLEDSPSPKELKEDISDIPGKEVDQHTLPKSMSLDDLKERDAFSRATVDYSDLSASKELPLRSGGSTSTLEGRPVETESKKGEGKPAESRLSSAVKKMISAFETSPSQGPPSVPRIKSESSLEGMSYSSEASTNSSHKPPTPSLNVPRHTQTDLLAGGTSGNMTIASADTVSSSRPGKQVMFSNKKPATSSQTSVSNTFESRRRSSSRRDRTSKTSMGDSGSIRSAEKHRRRSAGAYSPEQQQKTDRSAAASSITWIHPHLCITTASKQLKDLVNLEHLNSVRNVELNVREETEKRNSGDDMRDAAVSAREQSPVLSGWLINQGVRVVIVIIACGAVFLNNR